MSLQTGKTQGLKPERFYPGFQQKHSSLLQSPEGRLPAALSPQQEDERVVRQKDITSGKGFEKGRIFRLKGLDGKECLEGFA